MHLFAFTGVLPKYYLFSCALAFCALFLFAGEFNHALYLP
jgi:hypothetical protein